MTFSSLIFVHINKSTSLSRPLYMTLGEHIMLIRKQKGFSQSQLGKQIGTSGDIIGRYERNLITPSIEVIIKMADVFEVSIDFLVGKTSFALDKQALWRLEEIDRLPQENKAFMFSLIDMALRDFKARKAYAS
jgi:transcriptional regulator with XRE-family HTH domain